MVTVIPAAGMVVVVIIIAPFVAARQREGYGTQEQNQAQHVFYGVLHKKIVFEVY